MAVFPMPKQNESPIAFFSSTRVATSKFLVQTCISRLSGTFVAYQKTHT